MRISSRTFGDLVHGYFHTILSGTSPEELLQLPGGLPGAVKTDVIKAKTRATPDMRRMTLQWA